ncbi:unnamed protein product [Ilex paraguariensis]|uniref:Pectinesterase inhibitor domain-containing protein n=1 Tax=Ilex paraguariensis TaxID=185542 RepID=A0ABC8SV09_9AQUA
MKGGKLFVFGVSGILVVGVVIGLIAGVVHHNSSNDDDSDVLSTTSKAVASICSQTDYKRACVNSLDAVANNQSATPKDFIEAAIQVTIQEVKAAVEKTGTIGKAANDPLQKMAVEDCKDLFAICHRRAPSLLFNGGAVISYQQSCIDGFTQPELKSAISDGLLNATQLTDNALAIVSAISQILSAFNIPVNTTASSRRLLDTSEVDNDGYPAWFSAADRKLLVTNNGQVNPNAVVAKDGSGHYKTIAAALAAYPRT